MLFKVKYKDEDVEGMKGGRMVKSLKCGDTAWFFSFVKNKLVPCVVEEVIDAGGHVLYKSMYAGSVVSDYTYLGEDDLFRTPEDFINFVLDDDFAGKIAKLAEKIRKEELLGTSNSQKK